MRYYSEIIVSPEEFTMQDIIQKNILIRRTKYALLMGSVFCKECKSVAGALIIIKKINTNLQTVKELGYVLTNDNGEFAFLVKKRRGTHYQLNVYEPMITSCRMEDYDAFQQ